jgi:8-oxo-dGTP pyrophosphatase MutT (NUDIX family)
MKEASVLIIKNTRNQVLLLSRNFEPLGYGLPGGKVESKDFSSKEACIREVLEEIGVVLTMKEIVYVKTVKSVLKDTVVHVHKTTKLINEKDVVLSPEHSSFLFTKDFKSIQLAGNTLNFLDDEIIEEAAKQYLKSLPGVNYRSMYDFGTQQIEAFTKGAQSDAAKDYWFEQFKQQQK